MEKISEVLILDTGQTVKLEGERGTTFTPSVDANGNLSWTNDGGKQNPTTVNIKGERGEKGDTTVIDPSTATTYTLYNQTGNHTDGAMTQDAVTKEFGKLDEKYARNDGYYESMGVGMATNLKGQNAVDAEFAYRKSGGNVEVQDGNAMIEAIKGNTIAWNQLIENAKISLPFDFDNSAGSSSIIPTLLTTESNKFVPEHKYLLYASVKVSSTDSFGRIYWNTSTHQYNVPCIDTFSHFTGNSAEYITISAGKHVTGTVYSNIIDLTLIYGSGNEPSTPEQFEQDYFMWFGKPLTYEPYDAGSLRNTKVSALKTVGFNQWDESTLILGKYRQPSGMEQTSADRRCSDAYFPCIPNTDYYLGCGDSYGAYGVVICWYDANKNYISGTYRGSIPSNIHRSPSNAMFFRISSATPDGWISINISDPNRNGEYEPYKESTLPLDVTTFTGKLNGEGSSVVVFEDGMNSAGNVHDEIKIENGVVKAIKRVGKMDLGSPDWVYIAAFEGHHYFRANVSDIKKPSSDNVAGNILCARYKTDTAQNVYDNVNNKSISIANVDNQPLRVYDEQIISQSAFQTAMQGVELCYELAEPEVYVLDDFNLPKLYPVANGGTEEQLSNSPNSLPATLSIRYGLNAAAFIQNAPKNYISKESMSSFLSNLGSAMGGTWTMTWNSSTNKYDFSFTLNRSVDVKQPIEDK